MTAFTLSPYEGHDSTTLTRSPPRQRVELPSRPAAADATSPPDNVTYQQQGAATGPPERQLPPIRCFSVAADCTCVRAAVVVVQSPNAPATTARSCKAARCTLPWTFVDGVLHFLRGTVRFDPVRIPALSSTERRRIAGIQCIASAWTTALRRTSPRKPYESFACLPDAVTTYGAAHPE